MRLRNLDVTKKEEVEFLTRVYMEAFPLSERRPLERVFELYKDNPHFSIDLTVYEEKPVGFLCYWDLGDFVFAEYLAIDPDLRNGGMGKKVVDEFLASMTKPVVLEVELPSTILSERRIGFYQRLGFKIWENIQYQQPAYHTETQPVPMKLMSIGDIDVEKNIAAIRAKLYSVVYDIND